MNTTKLSAESLRKFIRQNSFPFDQSKLLVFGIRGALPKNLNNCSKFLQEHTLQSSVVDFRNPKCTIGIFNPLENKIAVFPGSTVPHITYMKKQKAKPNVKISNSIMSGFYSYYAKGTHRGSSGGAHQALRLQTNVFLRRSYNDLKFDNSDAVDVSNPNDNIHAAYCDGMNNGYSSAGCQVIVGQPKCKNRKWKENTSYWKKFHDYIYNRDQHTFDYMLMREQDAYNISLNTDNPVSARLRFGSSGDLVFNLQQKLHEKGYYNSNIDGKFLKDTLESVYKFQKETFDVMSADGVVGPATASKLGLVLRQIQ